ncbi:hypothetical protein LTR37_019677 [Vermiconidia calcicola]|uniref:Uncharacterized protein n=1 Tax=Vermiconidia calcicola TaxID=1690605 RepID=A0ACC3MDE6_9PEZI|nr:hypothetical protein LTR37_019677 [Vermiconidia calcicola]
MSRFLDLPGELRDLIYFYVFVELEGRIISWINRPSIIRRLQRRLSHRSPKHSTSLSLLCVSQQIRSEALHQVGLLKIQDNLDQGWHHDWLFRNVLMPRMHRDVSCYIDRTGACLQYVRHVRIVTSFTAFVLFHERQDGRLFIWQQTSMLLWSHLLNVSCITFTTENDTVEKEMASVADEDAKEGLTVDFNYLRYDLRQEETRRSIQRALPRLQDVRCEVLLICIRLRVSQDDKWSHWYAGDEFPHAPGDTESIWQYD